MPLPIADEIYVIGIRNVKMVVSKRFQKYFYNETLQFMYRSPFFLYKVISRNYHFDWLMTLTEFFYLMSLRQTQDKKLGVFWESKKQILLRHLHCCDNTLYVGNEDLSTKFFYFIGDSLMLWSCCINENHSENRTWKERNFWRGSWLIAFK